MPKEDAKGRCLACSKGNRANQAKRRPRNKVIRYYQVAWQTLVPSRLATAQSSMSDPHLAMFTISNQRSTRYVMDGIYEALMCKDRKTMLDLVKIHLHSVDGCQRILRLVWAVLFDPQLSSRDPAQPVRETHEPALALLHHSPTLSPVSWTELLTGGLVPLGPRGHVTEWRCSGRLPDSHQPSSDR